MYASLFADLPDHARLWVYGTDRRLTPDEADAVRDHLTPFVEGWTSHGRPVHGAFHILHDRFILIAADIPGADLSGCGIDASVHALEDLAARLGLTLLPALSIYYRDPEGGVAYAPRPVFRRMTRTGDVTAETVVFDTSLTAVGPLRAGEFERPLAKSWHGQVFRVASPSV